MGNRYTEVLMTYLRRPFSSWQAGIWLLGGVSFMLFGIASHGWNTYLLEVGIIFLGSSLWTHLRDQMVNARRSLTPKYIWPHILLFSVISLFVFLIFALLSSYRLDVLGTASALLMVFGYIGCYVATQIRVLPYFGLAIFYWTPVLSIRLPPHLLFAAEEAQIKWAIASLGVAFIFVAVAWMLWITEENWGYVKPAGFIPLAELCRTARHFIKDRLDRIRSRAPIVAGASPVNIPEQISYDIPFYRVGPIRAALGRWRHADVLQTGLLLALIPLFIIVLIISIVRGEPRWGVSDGVRFTTPFIMALPSLLVTNQWLKRWPFLQMESLRPASRRRYIQDFFIAVAVQIFFAWLAFAAMTATIAIARGHGIAGMETLLPFYSATFLVQPFGFLLCCWILLHRNHATLFFVIVVALESELFISFWNWEVGPMIDWAVFLMAISLILLPFVHRRWLNIEMG